MRDGLTYRDSSPKFIRVTFTLNLGFCDILGTVLLSDMATFEIGDLSPQDLIELVSAMNTDGVLHAITGSKLKVSDDDSAEIKTVLDLLRSASQTTNDLKSDSRSSELKYDISNLHSLEIQFLISRLRDRDVQFTIDEQVLKVPRHHEQVVDNALEESAAELQLLESHQTESRLIKQGTQSPYCEICGQTPAAPIDLRRQVGMVVLMKTYTSEMTLCSSCADEAYRQFQKSTAIKGWTGIRSALMNPIVIGTNAVNKSKHRKNLEKKG